MDEMTMPTKLSLLLIVSWCILPTQGRIFDLDLKDEDRREIPLSTFGFLKKGTLAVNMTFFSVTTPAKLSLNITDSKAMFGFTLDKSGSKGISSYMEDNQGKCILQKPPDPKYTESSVSMVFFKMNFKTLVMTLERTPDKGVSKLLITDDQALISNRLLQPMPKPKVGLADSDIIHKVNKVHRRDVGGPDPKSTTPKIDSPAVPQSTPSPKPTSPGVHKLSSDNGTSSPPMTTTDKPLPKQIKIQKIKGGYTAFFAVAIDTDEQEGLYNLYFHNCYNYPKEMTEVHLMLRITEANADNFLSAGEMPIPMLFFSLFVVYVLVSIVWATILKRGGDDVYKIHYLMLSVIIVKSLSSLFRSINSHFISVEGYHEEAWAVLYYIVYLTKGALLFSTILLIGAGWAFVKHILSIKEKKLFLIILPLQVLDNVAFIIVEESQEGQSEYTMWKEVFIIIDLLCCGAILFPVVWSIRHLQQSARTDGKAAISLQKLKLFRQFYIMIVCYIYFTRIIAYLIKITVPFQYEWLYDLFRETTTFLFFMVTGWKFRPASNNPYLQVPQDSDDELEMEEVVTESAALDTVKRVNQKDEGSTKQRESSHEYD